MSLTTIFLFKSPTRDLNYDGWIKDLC